MEYQNGYTQNINVSNACFQTIQYGKLTMNTNSNCAVQQKFEWKQINCEGKIGKTRYISRGKFMTELQFYNSIYPGLSNKTKTKPRYEL